ncbi:hypothetical protein [Streptomyces noursei]|uniref:hypothetical protein n=1 Tax=Streptomyces noursei TaxID=1971 RepID=UPI0005CB5C12
MTASPDSPAITPGKSPLPDADHDVVGIAEALRRSPHIRSVDDVSPGDETVWFRDADGTGFELSLTTMKPNSDPERAAYAWDAVASAIGNHPRFIRAALEQPSFGPLNLNTVTALTRTGNKYTLTLTVCPRPSHEEEPASPAADVALAADRLLTSDPSDSERAAAELLNYVAATWDKQDLPLREHAQTVARSLRTH